ncbi:MAG: NAD(P)/FAD-dependent oxidoreductase [Candidatus Bathyarchaeota archaeon]|nr:NAD(P)/FAD-dependent oxidoreductase [Candidatus Bathyarchaeota archaeon]
MRNFILGGGISGLICAYYNPSYTIISKNTGGQLKSPFPLGPQYLHRTPEVEELLMELHLPTDVKEVKIGYFYKGKFITPKDAHQREYWRKTRGNAPFTGECMMRKTENFEAYTTSPQYLMEALKLRVRNVILAEAYHIDLDERKISCWEGDFKYDNLISTIPLPEFMKMSNRGTAVLSWHPIHFEYAETVEDGVLERILWKEGREFDFIYFPWEGVDFYRITKLQEPYCVLEYTTSPFYEAYEIKVLKTHSIKYGKIIAGDAPEIEDVTFIGRYAKWDPKYFIHNVIRDAKRIGE